VQAARAQVELQRASHRLAKDALDDSVVVSPIDGVVISRNVEPGQTVAAVLSSPVLFVLAEDLRRMRVIASIDEADVGEVATGQAATFTVDAHPDRTFHAEVREIHNAPIVVQGVVTYDAVLDVDNRELELKPGMTASVRVVTKTVADTLRVPNAALRFSPPDRPAHEAGAQVWILASDEHGASVPQAVAVRPGASDGVLTAIAGGARLSAGDRVLVDLTPAGREAFEVGDD
jgi:HlyD family secretion protein